jgi:hypothetical protein
MPLVPVPPVRYRCAVWLVHGPFLPVEQHGRVVPTFELSRSPAFK